VPLDRVDNVLSRSGLDGFLVRVLHSGNWAALIAGISGKKRGVVRSLMMIRAADLVEPVNGICTRDMVLAQMRRAMSALAVTTDYIEWLVRLVAREALAKRA
jgi:hypothetical protein